MKVVILCGGQGTRLREETEYRPKPMVPIGGRPILWHIMKTYAHYGFKEFVLCLGYKGDMIRDYFHHYLWNTCDVTLGLGKSPSVEFHNNHAEEDWTVTLANTGELSMTAFRVKSIQRYIPAGEPYQSVCPRRRSQKPYQSVCPRRRSFIAPFEMALHECLTS